MYKGYPMKFKRIITHPRTIILIVVLLLSVIAINPHWGVEGVAIRQVMKDSAASDAGMVNPSPTAAPMSRERVIAVNGESVKDVASYHALIDGYPPNRSITITTNENTYRLTTKPNIVIDYRDEEVLGDDNTTTVQRVAYNKPVNGTQDIGLVVYPAPKSNLRLGLDLSGGTRVILKPKERVSQDDLSTIIDNIKQRLNVYGLSDIVVRSSKDLAGDDYIIVEIAGANKNEVQELLAKQGKFEAKIGDKTVFKGGNDITYVCRSAECSGIDRNVGCGQGAGGYNCRFSFQISLSPESAKRQADITRELNVMLDQSGNYLDKPLDLYLDDELVDTLQISAELKGRASTDILISGSGSGTTQQEAAQDTIANMKRLQTVLITGSLPVQLDIVKSDGISPVLGSSFIANAFVVGLLSMIAVSLVLVIRYRRPVISIPIIITMVSEVTIVFGFAAWVGWNLDLAAIAAIVIAIGSGVDDQIVIIDETLQGGVAHDTSRSWKERLTKAFVIIFASYFTLVAAMIPLWFAGAGLLRGFAITTIVGVTAGVLITRPAFAMLTEVLLKKDDED